MQLSRSWLYSSQSLRSFKCANCFLNWGRGSSTPRGSRGAGEDFAERRVLRNESTYLSKRHITPTRKTERHRRSKSWKLAAGSDARGKDGTMLWGWEERPLAKCRAAVGLCTIVECVLNTLNASPCDISSCRGGVDATLYCSNPSGLHVGRFCEGGQEMRELVALLNSNQHYES